MSALYQEIITFFKIGGAEEAILTEFRIFRKSFSNVSGSRKIFSHFFVMFAEKFKHLAQKRIKSGLGKQKHSKASKKHYENTILAMIEFGV